MILLLYLSIWLLCLGIWATITWRALEDSTKYRLISWTLKPLADAVMLDVELERQRRMNDPHYLMLQHMKSFDKKLDLLVEQQLKGGDKK